MSTLINKSIIIWSLLLPLLVACSSNTVKNKVSKKRKTVKTTGWFNSPSKIAMAKYKNYREAGMDHNSSLAMLRRYNFSRRKRSSYSQDLLKEIDQNLSMYCFSFDKYKKYKTQNECEVYTKQVLERCEIYNYGYYNREILWCVKRKLHLL